MSVNPLTRGRAGRRPCRLRAAGRRAGCRGAAVARDHPRRGRTRVARRAAGSRRRRAARRGARSRLRLPACGSRLETHAVAPRGSQSRVLVRVGCASGATWSVNVPVEVRREITVFVLRRSLGRGEALLAADVAAQKRVIPGLASPFVMRLEDLNGRHTRRPLSEGTALTADALAPALLIHRGQSVTLAASAGGIEVRAPGRALADATAQPAAAGAEPRIAKGDRGRGRKYRCGPRNPMTIL